MPFDGLPEGLAADIVSLRIALDGVKAGGWTQYQIGAGDGVPHCAIGWLLAATGWNMDEATRLALQYVYPALPEKARKTGRLRSIWTYNDGGSRKRIVKLFDDAVRLAERAVC